MDPYNLQLKCKNVLIKARAVGRGGGGVGGGLGGAAVPTGPVEPDKSSLWKDLFDCSDLQLFAIFMAEKLVTPRCVQIVSKRKQNPYYDFPHHTSW